MNIPVELIADDACATEDYKIGLSNVRLDCFGRLNL